MNDFYVLKDRKPISVDTTTNGGLIEWGKMLKDSDRKVGRDHINGHVVSTVFLGLDHSFGIGKPLLFETMIFGQSDLDLYQKRCSTWEEAEVQHKSACDLVRSYQSDLR